MLGQVGGVDMWALEIGHRKGIDDCTDYALGVNSDRFKDYSRRSLRFESLPLHELYYHATESFEALKISHTPSSSLS